MSSVTYRDFYSTGEQDADNVFTPLDDIDIYRIAELMRAGKPFAEELRDMLDNTVMDEEDFDPSEAEEYDLDPSEAYQQWRAGWISQAATLAERAARELAESDDDD